MRDGILFGNFDMVKFGGWCFSPLVIESVGIYDDNIIVFTSIHTYLIKVLDNTVTAMQDRDNLWSIYLSAENFANFKAYVEREFFGMEVGEDE